MSRQGTRMYNDNRFKLGLFGMNCSGGLITDLDVTVGKAEEIARLG
jgi:hypothetical protein